MVGSLGCGCGYVAESDDDATLGAAVQPHAAEAHGVRLVSETIVRLAREAAAEHFESPRSLQQEDTP